MNVEEALVTLDTALEKECLNNLQELVFRQAWAGQTYSEMAESFGYNANYIKDVGYKLWKLLSKAFNEEVTKSNFRSVFRRRYVASQRSACQFSQTGNPPAHATGSGGRTGDGIPQDQYSVFMCNFLVGTKESSSTAEDRVSTKIKTKIGLDFPNPATS